MSEGTKMIYLFLFITIPEVGLNMLMQNNGGTYYAFGFLTGYFLFEVFDYKKRKAMRVLAMKLEVFDGMREAIESEKAKHGIK